MEITAMSTPNLLDIISERIVSVLESLGVPARLDEDV